MFSAKVIVVTASIVLSSLTALGQQPPKSSAEKFADLKVQKQILVYDLENRIKEVGFAAPRVFARYEIAAWLWKDGKDDIGRAEDLAVLAVDDMYRNKGEIPPVYFNAFSSDLFALLARNSPTVARSLKDKYRVDSNQEAGVQFSLLNHPGGEKSAVDSAVRTIYGTDSADSTVVPLVAMLQQGNSSELNRLLEAIVFAEERTRGKFSPWTLNYVSPAFADENMQQNISLRFVTIVLDRARYASQLQFGPFQAWYDVLSRNLPLIEKRSPQQLPEANVVRSVLFSRISQESREAAERNERINSSSDKLAATIAEAEKEEDPLVKNELYWRAARLALQEGKFRRSVELVQTLREVDMSSSGTSEEFRTNEENQFLAKVWAQALKSSEPEAALVAIGAVDKDAVRRSEGHTDVAKYYVKVRDLNSARAHVKNSMIFAATVPENSKRASLYLALIPIAHDIDPTDVYEINSLAAKSVNTIPSLNVEDKPETQNYQDHVTRVMDVNWNLIPSLRALRKLDRDAAEDLASRIEKREVRIIADCLIAIANFEDLAKLQMPKERARPRTTQPKRE